MLGAFQCPLTLEPMVSAVVATDGHSYEEREIRRWMELRRSTSPITREPILPHLRPNTALSAAARLLSRTQDVDGLLDSVEGTTIAPFLCPQLGVPLHNPVIGADGQSHEQSLAPPSGCVPNHTLRQAIQQFEALQHQRWAQRHSTPPPANCREAAASMQFDQLVARLHTSADVLQLDALKSELHRRLKVHIAAAAALRSPPPVDNAAAGGGAATVLRSPPPVPATGRQWIAGTLSRRDAEAALSQHSVEGAFLVRRSSACGELVLSFVRRGRIRHCRIVCTADRFKLVAAVGGVGAASLEELIQSLAAGSGPLRLRCSPGCTKTHCLGECLAQCSAA